MEDVVTNSDYILSNFLAANPEVKFIELQWIDLSATVRTRVLTARNMLSLVKNKRYHGVAPTYLTMVGSSVLLSSDRASEAIGQSFLIPDMASLHLCPWNKHRGILCCFFSDRIYNLDPPSNLNPLCPRRALHYAIEAAEKQGLQLLIGIEIEFTISPHQDSHAGKTYSNVHQASSRQALDGEMGSPMEDICTALEHSGIAVQHFQAEGQPRQFELALEPCAPMNAADTYISARATIRTTCAQHGFVACFHPWTPVTNGLHVNVSVQDDFANKSYFLGGILEHMQALFAFGLPLPVCYKRVNVNSYHQATGSFVSWGDQNRQTPVRRKSEGLWELRFADGLTHAYLFLAAVIQAGVLGVELCLEPGSGNCSVDPNSLTFAQRKELGIVQPLPSSMLAAQEALVRDEILKSRLGDDLVNTFIDITRIYAEKAGEVGNVDSDAQRLWFMDRG
ncbi:hypothetical protein NX059_004640 [Plenodomus lindquistii]|nr:hypothetical protein NX059_004640 [Plenodomus lindquistii]